ncbi:phosphoribosylanthranilate isomerase [Silicimonas algicola]|uniref:N-(5'-phosphoribosyl)anthranilate isomerase n=1 Tax=Silicimonas algicola TaxID=1826607 RepID=A0A316G882_9RHOB|nr:phosphoribosylanthranilate isomerase [Silicimonas algicola]AZQ68737.1 phosphoribosylanthranilate isomerase [Silicimonas algicola]PWK56186.1 phosphoribosylanthranilate isomerase [Silicimonas algicola]
MQSTVRVKICGLRTPEAVAAAAEAGASYVGFVFFPRSPRALTPDEARALSVDVPSGVAKVGLLVDADDALLDDIDRLVPLDMLQLHGSETPERVAEVRTRYGLPVMKAIGIADAADLSLLDDFAGVADQILVDAKPPTAGALPGGNGLSFDWRLIANRRWSLPWMLAGGLTPSNVAEAVALTGAPQVDVSSGVESAPGVKDLSLIKAFVDALR